MQLTDEQTRAVDLFRTSRSLKVHAFAGAGKTSTLTAMARTTRRRGLYLAFNKAIADEARGKFPDTVDCRTTHSIAFRAVPDAFRGNTAKLTWALQANHVVQLLGLSEIAVGGMALKPRSMASIAIKTVQRFCQSGSAGVPPPPSRRLHPSCLPLPRSSPPLIQVGLKVLVRDPAVSRSRPRPLGPRRSHQTS